MWCLDSSEFTCIKKAHSPWNHINITAHTIGFIRLCFPVLTLLHGRRNHVMYCLLQAHNCMLELIHFYSCIIHYVCMYIHTSDAFVLRYFYWWEWAIYINFFHSRTNFYESIEYAPKSIKFKLLLYLPRNQNMQMCGTKERCTGNNIPMYNRFINFVLVPTLNTTYTYYYLFSK